MVVGVASTAKFSGEEHPTDRLDAFTMLLLNGSLGQVPEAVRHPQAGDGEGWGRQGKILFLIWGFQYGLCLGWFWCEGHMYKKCRCIGYA